MARGAAVRTGERAREGGFIVIHRRIRSSALFRSLTAEQRSVFFAVLLLANWCAGKFWHAGRWIEVHRGELAHSLATIAEEAAVSIKVVRTTICKLLADDSPAGGRGPFLAERWIASGREVGSGVGTEVGPRKGTALRVLRVLRYDEYQKLTDPTGTPSGTAGAQQGHASGTAGAPIEPGEPGEPPEPGEPKAPSPAASGAHQGVIDAFCKLWLEVRRGDAYQVQAKDTAAVKRLVKGSPAAGDRAEVDRRIRRYLADPWATTNGGLAHFCGRWAGLDGAGQRAGPKMLRPLGAPEPATTPEAFEREVSGGF